MFAGTGGRPIHENAAAKIEAESRSLAIGATRSDLRVDGRILVREADATASAAAVAADGSLLFTAPSSGRFYQRPTPDKPNFIAVGEVIERGQTVGLLEVMKTFTRINFDDPKLPVRVKVVAIVAGDQADLAFGDVILRVEAVDD